jgi:hypothetical protein
MTLRVLMAKVPGAPGERNSAAMFLLAGFAVMAGLMCGIEGWGDCRPVGLAWITLGMILGVAGLVRMDGEICRESRERGGRGRRWLLAGLMVLHLVAAVAYCRAVPAENIDCYTFQRDAARDLLHGARPYDVRRPNIYGPADTIKFYGAGIVSNGQLEEGLFYPPMTLLWVLPGYVAGDVRYSYILAVLLAALCLYAVHPGRWALGLAGFLLLNPFTFVVENRCWTEPLLLMALSASVYAASRRRAWLPLALGVFLASKQYNFLALPFLGYLVTPFQWRSFCKLLAGSLTVAMATILPFAVWDLRGLWHDVVLYYVRAPHRVDALSYAVPFPWATRIGPLLLAGFAVWVVRLGLRAREQSTAGRAGVFAAAYALALLVFVGTGKQAAGNYYFLVTHGLLLAAVARIGMRATVMESSVLESTGMGQTVVAQ